MRRQIIEGVRDTAIAGGLIYALISAVMIIWATVSTALKG